MRNRAERRNFKLKEITKRLKICKDIAGYNDNDTEYIKHKSDIPHSHGSNWWNAYETKRMRNRQQRFKDKNKLKKEIEFEEK